MTVGPLDELAAALAPVLARAMPALAAAVPAEPAAVLGRHGVPESDVPNTQRGIPFPSSAREPVLAALRWMLGSRSHHHEQLKVDQLIGPLQRPLTDATPPPPAAPQANPLLAPNVRTAARWVLVTQSGSNFTGPVRSLDSLRPGVTDLVLALVSELTGHPSIVPRPPSHPPTEPELAAAHGAAYVALALATASSVLRTLRDATDNRRCGTDPRRRAGQPEITALLADLDFDGYRHKDAKAMLAIERFTGHELPAEHFEGLAPDGRVYRIEQI